MLDMSSKSKYYPLLRQLLKKPAFTTAEALELGIPRHGLAYFEKLGVIERLAKGI